MSNIDYLVLVNKNNRLPDNWEDRIELSSATNAWGDTITSEKESLRKYYELRDALKEEGIEILLDDSYRSVTEQQKIWEDFEKKYGIDYVKKYVAVPGYSEHHTGLAIDIVIKKDGKLIEENEDMIQERDIFSRIQEKLPEYGFILRYPENKKEVTGYSYEPWHFRYVGSVEIAKEIMSKGLTLEEYLNMIYGNRIIDETVYSLKIKK